MRFPDCIKSAVKAGAWLQPGCLAGWVVDLLSCTKNCCLPFLLWTLCPGQAQILPAGHLKMAQHLPHLYTALWWQVGKFASLGNVKGLRTAESNKCTGYKVRLTGKWPRDTLRKAGDMTLIILFCKEEMKIASVLRWKNGWWAPHGIFPWFLPLWLGHIVQLLLDLKFIINKIHTDSSWALRNFLILSSLLEGSLGRYKDGFSWLPGLKETRTQQERQKVKRNNEQQVCTIPHTWPGGKH